MADKMDFPDTVEEFMEQYKVVDTDGVYMSKGAELVPIFRMRQWFEHVSSMDTISRQVAIDLAEEVEMKRLKGEIDLTYAPMVKGLTQLPSAQPDPNVLEQEYLKGWEDGRKNLLEYISRLLSLPSAQSDWNELMVICDHCGHAIHVKKENQ